VKLDEFQEEGERYLEDNPPIGRQRAIHDSSIPYSDEIYTP